VFRIVQEALANVRRHAGARAVSVTVAAQAGELLLSVDDDGRGFDPELPGEDGRPRFGLRTMAERAASLGGQLEVESALDRGTRIRLRIPLAARGRRAG
ncbi:MAG: histidine kinase, partial [Dehalococcoidia bacterium]|nr:histidine kinase [Dehalococcoidia bacterium]